MTTPVSNSSVALPAATVEASQRQQVERALARLPAAPNSGGVAARPVISHESLLNSVQQVNEVLRHHGVKFILDGEPPRTITRIVDMESGEEIRRIPSEETLAVAERLDELRGLLYEGEG